jgi:hypothetical protein
MKKSTSRSISRTSLTKKRVSLKRRPSPLPDGAPLACAPDNEQGVVYLFSHLARRKYGLRVERVQAGFPDCIAYKDGKPVRIEFEFKSKNFKTHGHSGKRCDWIVCWEHNWPGVPKHLRVVELRRDFGQGFNVWFQPVTSGEYSEALAAIRSKSDSWSVPSLAMEGDLLLFYRTAPESCVRDVFRVASSVDHVKADWKKGLDYMAVIQRVCTLKAPLNLSQLKENRVLRNAGFVRGQMQGRPRATEYWPDLYRMIISLNPSVAAKLQKKFGPERVC